MKRKVVSILLVAIMAVTLLAGCSLMASTKKSVGGTLVAGITEMSGNFNPGYYSSAYDAMVVDLVFQSLLKKDFDDIYQPNVAKEWKFSEDGKSITFKLREDIVFSDGEPLTAKDIIFTYKLLSDPSYTGRYSSYAMDLVGYDEYSAGETTEFKGIVADGDYTVTFHFKEPMRVNLDNCQFAIMPEHYYGAEFEVGNTESVEAITTTPMGSGPYTLEKFEEKQFAALKKNPKYFNADKSYYIENIVCKFVDTTTDITELTSKAIDLLPGVIDPVKINQARDTGFISENSYDRSGYGYIKFNCEQGFTSDPKVRQALYYSFNVKEFVESYYKDEKTGDILASVQYHPFSQVSWAIDDKLLKELPTYEFDLEKAGQMLDELGWKVGSSGFREKDGEVMEIKIAAMPDENHPLATLIPMWERDWGQGLKIKLNIAYLEFNTILDYVLYDSDANVDSWNLFFLATSMSTADPHIMYSEFHSSQIGSGKDNLARYRNARVDELLDQGKVIPEIKDAKPLYQEMAKILSEEVALIPVYANTYFDLYNEKIKDLKTGSIYDWIAALENAYIEE